MSTYIEDVKVHVDTSPVELARLDLCWERGEALHLGKHARAVLVNEGLVQLCHCKQKFIIILVSF
jgi:hypothetical protein